MELEALLTEIEELNNYFDEHYDEVWEKDDLAEKKLRAQSLEWELAKKLSEMDLYTLQMGDIPDFYLTSYEADETHSAPLCFLFTSEEKAEEGIAELQDDVPLSVMPVNDSILTFWTVSGIVPILNYPSHEVRVRHLHESIHGEPTETEREKVSERLYRITANDERDLIPKYEMNEETETVLLHTAHMIFAGYGTAYSKAREDSLEETVEASYAFLGIEQKLSNSVLVSLVKKFLNNLVKKLGVSRYSDIDEMYDLAWTSKGRYIRVSFITPDEEMIRKFEEQMKETVEDPSEIKEIAVIDVIHGEAYLSPVSE